MSGSAETVATTRSSGRELLRHLVSSPLSITGLIILGVVFAGACLAALIAPYDPDLIDAAARLAPPSLAHWGGTDEVGRDIFSRILWGAHASLGVGLGVVAIGAGAGTLIGCFSGLAGGWVDALIMRIMDIVMALPGLVVALALAAALGPSLINAMIAIGVLGIPGYGRVARGLALRIRKRNFVQAARTFGAGRWHILIRHVVPNVLASMLVLATLDIGNAMLGVATLSFIGLGARPPLAEWGAMVNAGQSYILTQWWYPMLPGLAILMTALAFNLIGDAIGPLVDPRREK